MEPPTESISESTRPPECSHLYCPNYESPPPLQLCGRCKKAVYCSRECQTACWHKHKRHCPRPNYIIKLQLHPGNIVDPPVERTLSVPAKSTFWELHIAIQLAFGWAEEHAYDFTIPDPDFVLPPERELETAEERIERLNTMMKEWLDPIFHRPRGPFTGVDPSRPREYLVRVADSLKGLRQEKLKSDKCFQTAYNWPFAGFSRVRQPWRQHPDTVEHKYPKFISLFKLFDDERWKGKSWVYTYHFGNEWEHQMTIVGRASATVMAVCLEGTGHPVAEDVGGWRRWERLKLHYRRRDAEQIGRMAWYQMIAADGYYDGYPCSNGDKKGLFAGREHLFDLEDVNKKLEEFWKEQN